MMPRNCKKVLIAIPSIGRATLSHCIRELQCQRAVRADEKVDIRVFLNNHSKGAEDELRVLGCEYQTFASTGYSDARNFVMHHALVHNYDILLFVDDDEIPERTWLDAMLTTWRNCNAQVVTGPVEVELPATAPEWTRFPGIHRADKVVPFGPYFDHFGSGNSLIDLRSIPTDLLTFESSLNGGGEDTLFFFNLRKNGIRAYWAPEARVRERQEEDRLTFTAYLNRRWKLGLADGRVSRFGVYGGKNVHIIRLAASTLVAIWRLIFFKPVLRDLVGRAVCAIGSIVYFIAAFRGSVPTKQDSCRGDKL